MLDVGARREFRVGDEALRGRVIAARGENKRAHGDDQKNRKLLPAIERGKPVIAPRDLADARHQKDGEGDQAEADPIEFVFRLQAFRVRHGKGSGAQRAARLRCRSCGVGRKGG